MRTKTVILGAAGRDFHNFNTVFRQDADTEVVAFTATQIPDIDGKRYPKELAGELYPEGIPIVPEDDLERLIREKGVTRVVFAYSDVHHTHVMNLASRALACGADYWLLGPHRTALPSKLPVVAVCAVRTGCGKSPVSRAVVKALVETGRKTAVIRHPMPYGELAKQRLQRFDCLDDLDHFECTIEEREEYEPHIMEGTVVFAGADYQAILDAAEKEADVILWDGGNNDLPFYAPDLHITLVDPHRVGHESVYHPGEANFLAADLVVIPKVSTAPQEDLEHLRETIRTRRSGVPCVEGDLAIGMDSDLDLAGKKVLCIEDGPTTTHGGMAYGAAVLAAQRAGAEVVDPRPHAQGSLKEVFAQHAHLQHCLPAMGYSGQQIEDLADSIKATPCDAILVGTPIDLRRMIELERPSARAIYTWNDLGTPTLAEHLLRGLPEKKA